MERLLDGIQTLISYGTARLSFYLVSFWVVLSTLLVSIYLGIEDFLSWLLEDTLCFVLDSIYEFVVKYNVQLPVIDKVTDYISLPVELLSVANYYAPLLEGLVLFAGYWFLAITVYTLRVAIKFIPFIG